MIDSHIHFWDPAELSYPWLSGSLNRSFLPADLSNNSTNIQGMVFVQADCEPQQALAEVAWASQLDAPISGVVAFAALENGSHLTQHLDALLAVPIVRGIRRNVQGVADNYFTDPQVHLGLGLVEQSGLSFDLCLRWQQLPLAPTLLRGCATLPVVIDHLAKPPLAAGWNSPERREWQNGLRELAKRDATMIKLSGLAPEAPPSSNLREAAHPFLDFAVELFGAERCMFGSDWPVSTTVPTPRHYDDWATIVLGGLSSAESEQIAWRTATTFYRLAS